MKKIIKTITYIAIAAAAFGCAKAVSEGPNEAEARFLDSWMSINYPGLKPTGLGIYIIPEEEVEGTGAEVKEGGYAYVEYTVTDIDGNIALYTGKETAKQLGTYDTTSYYGPKVVTTIETTIQAGLAEAMVGMKVGGHRKAIIPSWLMTYKVYDSEKEYLENSASGSHAIYDFTVIDFTDSISKHEISIIEKFIEENPLKYPFDDRMVNDTLGFYYQPVEKGTSTENFEKDTTIYINYTGRLLNGLVFDTSIEKVAKDNGLYSPSKTYGPVTVTCGENATDIKMGSSSSNVITGFALTIMHMHPMEKGLGIFYSPLGYNYNGSGSSIPGYSPLIFEIEVVAKPEE